MLSSYSLRWKASSPGISVDGVEFQCLPSGLHDLETDTVYFTKDNLTGVSVFNKVNASAEDRNANFAAVGALISSRDNQSIPWRYVSSLTQVARELISNLDDHSALESLWEHRSQRLHRPKTTTAEALSSDDPALSLVLMLKLFGPLLFPLQRAALLGKGILLNGRPPVKTNCEIGMSSRHDQQRALRPYSLQSGRSRQASR